MRKLLALLSLVALLGLGAAAPAFAGGAQPVAQDETTEEDDGTDYGWIGLLGLAGLAGLAGRKRRDDDVRSAGPGATTTRRD